MNDETVAGNTPNTAAIRSMALELCCWIQEHLTDATSQDNKLISMLGQSLPTLIPKTLNGLKVSHHKIWSHYYTLWTLQHYVNE